MFNERDLEYDDEYDNDEEIDDLFNKLDENKNGIIEYEEIVRGFSDRKKLLVPYTQYLLKIYLLNR